VLRSSGYSRLPKEAERRKRQVVFHVGASHLPNPRSRRRAREVLRCAQNDTGPRWIGRWKVCWPWAGL
jgi:hypothetical protein